MDALQQAEVLVLTRLIGDLAVAQDRIVDTTLKSEMNAKIRKLLAKLPD